MNARKVSLVVILLVTVSTFHLVLTVLPVGVRAATLFVGGSDPGNYTTIQEAIDAAKPGDTVFVYSGIYLENVEVYKTLNLTGESVDTTIIDANTWFDAVSVTADWVNVTGFTMVNAGGGGDDAGIDLNSVRNCYIANNNVTFSEDDAISLVHSSNNTIANNTVTGNWVGIYLEHSNNNLIVNNTIYSNDYEGIWLDLSNNTTVMNNVMSNDGLYLTGRFVENWNTHTIDTSNTINGRPVYYWKNVIGGTIPPGAGQILLANCSNVLIANQSIVSSSFGIEIGFSQNNTIVNNTLSDQWDGILLYMSDNNIITGNNALSNEDDGIAVYSSIGNKIFNNTASFNFWGGISVYGGGENTIFNNTAKDNGDGISFWSSHNNTAFNNTATYGFWNGFYLEYATGNRIHNNIVANNQDGFHLYSSHNNTFHNNTALNNDIGFYLTRSDYNTIADSNASLSNAHGIGLYGNSNSNTVVNNTFFSNVFYGIHSDFSNHSRIYHNRFIENGLQALDPLDTNEWDNGYPSGGNYWSDYAGVDNCSGPNQDICPDPDGIGDTPYVIDTDSQDRYPLMSLYRITRTRPPTELQAALTGDSLGNVTLTWSLSPDDGMGLESVIGYKVYRNLSYNPEGLDYELIASLANGTSTFVDISAGEGNPNNYFYKVCAVDSNNNTSCATCQVGKFSRLLSSGPNLLSIPLVQSNESIEEVYQTVRFDWAWTYDPWDMTNPWKWYMPLKPYEGDISTINHTMGVWIDVTEGSNLTVAGTVPLAITIQLKSGWNLVGFPSFASTYTVGDLKVDIGATRVEGFDPLAPPYFLKVLSDEEILQTSFGYWVYVENDTAWTVVNS